MQTRIYRKKYVNGSVMARRDIKKIENQARRLFTPIPIYLCHQKPYPARETVPLSQEKRGGNLDNQSLIL
jgi:hypothetical protein